ncbi:OLC1v1006386C1 [Oldenlandia corymbosa var. corymbosa]|uniref:E3 ubiquitin-protein ligase listerin n=1 Tax=Oldenlandia corymbosa var. corymbosa TaxID=529605 RepID=A0AAV1DJ83_OLDCO|nr:OLC1v1006386C1 [Oldenlandia corymbosa var. corymbosa]
MGRPKGDGARSKYRPSSSSLAASLLPSGSTTLGFGGFVGSSRVDSSLLAESSTDPSLDVDGELAQHLKRLSRKDPTTKIKALTALSQLVKEKSAKEVAVILPQWAFEYKKLLLDYNREVRRATHDTMTYLVRAVGRDLAPHLKFIMGPWWFSQFDSIYEVSQAAKRSFQAAFPAQEKRLDALTLSATEIFLYIEENLKLTPQSMSDKVTASDELEEMYQQVISSSLLALATLLDILMSLQSDKPSFENITAEPKNASKARANAVAHAERLFSGHKSFSDFLKSQSSSIRSATYSVLGSFIKNIPHAINEENIKSLAVTVLGSFQEKDPRCHSPMWDMVLLFCKRFPESWTLLNVQKIILNRFWHFLKSGCFGSHQVSYPALVLFLDAVPPKAVVGEKFFLEFFQKLWEGRSLSYSLAADRFAFFSSMKECLLWALQNASRYCDGEDAVHHLRNLLVNEILLKLLWLEYFQLDGLKDPSSIFPRISSNSSEDLLEPSKKERVENLQFKHPVGCQEDLGKCIVEILSGVHLLEKDLLLPFSSAFRNHCLSIIRQVDSSSGNAEYVLFFLSMLDQHAVKKGETWPFDYLAVPMLLECFQVVKTLDSPDAVRFMVTATYIFGPYKIVQELACVESGTEQFLGAFSQTFVPWCLEKSSLSTSHKLDFLLALIDYQYFPEQWNIIVTHAIPLEGGTLKASDSKLTTLAELMEKARERIRKLKCAEGSHPENWRHENLDIAAVSIINCNPPFGTSEARILRALIGGTTEEDYSLLSKSTLNIIFDGILRKLLSFVSSSTFSWVQYVVSLIPSLGKLSESRDFSTVLEDARFAYEVLTGSFFCLLKLDSEDQLVSKILAAVFVIDWEFNILKTFLNDEIEEEHTGQMQMRMTFCESMHAFRSNLSYQNLKSLSNESRKSLKDILVHALKWALLKEDKLDSDKSTSLYFLWLLEIRECLCVDQFEEQELLDEFMSQNEFWPSWILPYVNSQGRSAELKSDCIVSNGSGNLRFVSLIDKLISRVGIHKVVAGAISSDSFSLSEEPKEHLPSLQKKVCYSRAWLAAEMLCTWKWQCGSALTTFLPLLCNYATSEDYSPDDGILDSIVTILLDGALVHGGNKELAAQNMWPGSHIDFETINSPFLRALVSLLDNLFQNNIWGKDKAMHYFKLLRDKLLIGETVNFSCLSILPACMDVLIGPLSILYGAVDASDTPDSSDDPEVHATVMDWLEKASHFPALYTWTTGNDMEGWFHLVVSCYPLRATKGLQNLRRARFISSEERVLLLQLFQKQRQKSGASTVMNKLPAVQVLLSKLILVSVAYCWEDFSEDDWQFILYHVRWWIESAVVTMEEVAENINETFGTCSDLGEILNKVELAVSHADHSALKIARNAVAAFSLFCGFCDREKNEEADPLNPLNERWEIIKDRILECILRLFFSTGLAEAISGSSIECSSLIAGSRLDHTQFWELVASCVVKSSSPARDKAAKSIEMWGLTKGPISSLYAILFSSKPLPYMQFAAYNMLSTGPLSRFTFLNKDLAQAFVDTSDNQDSNPTDPASEQNFRLREEVCFMFEKFACEVFEMDLLASERVNTFIAWGLLLSHLVSLPPSAPVREKIIQYIKDAADSVIIDCLFQHIPLESLGGSSSKRKELPETMSMAATAATHAISTGSILPSAETIWPVTAETMTSLAGAIYGLMLCILPAYVREWFNSIRDRSRSSVIESFTIRWCSPVLIANDLNQIKKSDIGDENFSVSVSKSANEVVATYTKDETGMDLVIRLPASYPLRPVDVDCTRSLGISDVKQRKWLMSMTLFVRNQNGAIAESIRIWKSNFDKEFEGVEECPICYSVIHTSNHSLPRLACKTCKHKFHSACLYKWFSTSHKSTCPLCQSPF